jgi:hypothetical protein
MLKPHIDLAGATALPRVVMFGSGKPVTCAVMDYSRRLADAVNARRPGFVQIATAEPETPAAFIGAMQRELAAGRIVHLQLPIEGWGNSILPGLGPMLARIAAAGW